jgi:beta-phosphoglucomutase-like phosphatase (HAD superfamily)
LNFTVPDAIVFDFDGVLVLSEPLHLRATQEALALRGVPLTADEYYDRYVGYNDIDMFLTLARDRGLTWCSDDLQEMLTAKALRFEALEASAAITVPGAPECVRRMAEIAPLAIASGARRDEVQRILHRIGLETYFRAIVASGDTEFSKPAPDPYIAATAVLHARPECSIAIEDTAAGLAAAKAAGLRCIGITTTFPAARLALADVVVHSMDEITPDLVRALIVAA